METSRQKKFAKELKILNQKLKKIKTDFLELKNFEGSNNYTELFLLALSKYCISLSVNLSIQIKSKLEYDEESREQNLTVINKLTTGKKKSKSKLYLEAILDAAINTLKILESKKAELNKSHPKCSDRLSNEYKYIFENIIKPLKTPINELASAFKQASIVKISSPFSVLKSKNVQNELFNATIKLENIWKNTEDFYKLYYQTQKKLEAKTDEHVNRFVESMEKIIKNFMEKYGYRGNPENFIKLPPFKEFKDYENQFLSPISPETAKLIDIKKAAEADHKSILSEYKSYFKYKVELGFKKMKNENLNDIQSKIKHISGLKPGNKLEKSLTKYIKEYGLFAYFESGDKEALEKFCEQFDKYYARDAAKAEKIRKHVATLIGKDYSLDDLLENYIFK